MQKGIKLITGLTLHLCPFKPSSTVVKLVIYLYSIAQVEHQAPVHGKFVNWNFAAIKRCNLVTSVFFRHNFEELREAARSAVAS